MFLSAATRPLTGGERQRSKGQALDEWDEIVAWAVREARLADLDEVRSTSRGEDARCINAASPLVQVQRTDEQTSCGA